MQTYRLTTKIPEEGRKLIDDFAHENGMTFNEAVRLFMRESPKLVKFAKEKGREIDLDVEPPGGYRPKKEED